VLVRPSNLKALCDTEHLVSTGHGLKVPLCAWICVNFYIGIIYDTLKALASLINPLNIVSFIPSFIAAVLYTLLGSYTWYWATVGAKNNQCALFFIKILLVVEILYIVWELFSLYDSDCDADPGTADDAQVIDGEVVDCGTNSLFKFFAFIALMIHVIPSSALFCCGTRAYYARMQFGKLPDVDDVPKAIGQQPVVPQAPTGAHSPPYWS
jgi:hypothetical protein